MQVPGLIYQVPGTRNLRKPVIATPVPGVPGVPCSCAHMRHARNTYTHAHPRARYDLYTQYTRNTRNNPDVDSYSAVPGTRNRKPIPGTSL